MNTTHLQKQEQLKVAGHLEEKRDVFQMVLSWKLPNGKRERKSLSTGLPVKGNKTRAKAMLRNECTDLENALAVEQQNSLIITPNDMGNMQFADFMEHYWLVAIKKDVKETTFGGYWCNTTRIIAPYFRAKGILLKNLSENDVNNFYEAQLFRVKGATVQRFHANIHQALKYAVKKGFITHSIMEKVDRPKNDRFVGKFLRQSEVVALFEAVRGHKLELGVILGAFYGLRRSEVVGLKWEAIDFEASTITIEHTVTMAMVDGKHVEIVGYTTKSKSSNRTLPLVPQFRAKLLELRDEQANYRKLAGNSYDKADCQFVYVNQLGKRIKPDYLTRCFPEFMEKQGFRRIRFHDLRHSCASLLLASGVPLKQIQEWLGHSNFAITADTYAHLDFNSKLGSASAMKWIEQTSLSKPVKPDLIEKESMTISQ